MKAARHAMILDLIETFNIETQDDLAMRLKDRGINVTQATVSRDIKELRLIKVLAEDGGYKYATVDKAEAGLKERFIRIFSNSVVSIASTSQPHHHQDDLRYRKRCCRGHRFDAVE